LAASSTRSFRKFRDFFAAVGPNPYVNGTLDRIDNNDREYAPGKVHWADKRTQNNNKGDTVSFCNSTTGEYCTASRLAKLQKVTPSAIRKRLKMGWTDAEIIARKRLRPVPVSPVVEPIKAPPPNNLPRPPLDVIWVQAMVAAYPGGWCVLTPKEKKMFRDLGAHYCGGGLPASQLEDMINHTIINWSSVAQRAELITALSKPQASRQSNF
jgi:hypothetical protein